MIICVVVSADTMCRVVLCDIAKVLTHAFTKCSLGVANVLFVADCASDAINDIIGLAVAVSYSVILSACNRTDNRTSPVEFDAVHAGCFGASLACNVASISGFGLGWILHPSFH